MQRFFDDLALETSQPAPNVDATRPSAANISSHTTASRENKPGRGILHNPLLSQPDIAIGNGRTVDPSVWANQNQPRNNSIPLQIQLQQPEFPITGGWAIHQNAPQPIQATNGISPQIIATLMDEEILRTQLLSFGTYQGPPQFQYTHSHFQGTNAATHGFVPTPQGQGRSNRRGQANGRDII